MVNISLVPRPLPDFILLPIFLHGFEIKSESGLGTRLGELEACMLWLSLYKLGRVTTCGDKITS